MIHILSYKKLPFRYYAIQKRSFFHYYFIKGARLSNCPLSALFGSSGSAILWRPKAIRSAYQKFCVLRLCETANCDHRNRNCTFDLCYKIPVKTAMDQARRPHKFIVEVYHTGYMESIYTVFLFQVCSYCCCVLYALSSLEEMYEKAMSRSRRKQSSA